MNYICFFFAGFMALAGVDAWPFFLAVGLLLS